MLSCRSLTRSNRELGYFSNPSVYAGIGIVLCAQALFVFAPFMHAIFDAARPDPEALALALAASLLVLPVTWLEERWRRRRA